MMLLRRFWILGNFFRSIGRVAANLEQAIEPLTETVPRRRRRPQGRVL
jgi:hypothetical protein